MKERLFNFIKKNPTIFLTILSAYGYYCAYFFQAGSCLYFHIPFIFINIEIIDVIYFMAGTTGLVLYLTFHLRGIVFDRPKNTRLSALKRLVFEINFVLFFIIFFIYSTIEFSTNAYWIIVAIFLALNVILFARYLYIKIKMKRFKYLLKTQFPGDSLESINEKVFTKLSLEKASSNEKRTMTLIEESINYAIYLFVAIPFLIGFMGFGSSSKQSYFPVLSGNTPMVILKKYGDEVICKNFDKKSKKLGDSLFVFKIDGSTKLNFTLQELK